MTAAGQPAAGGPRQAAGGPRPAAGGLRRFARPRPPAGKATPDERCEVCATKIGSQHAHMVDLQRRSIACACQACALLFTRQGGRYRTVPDRVLHDRLSPLTEAEWAELQIPVSIAFFFVNSALGSVIASYPSPAGVTECQLDLAAWDRLAAAHPLLRAPVPDVEAILVAGGGPRDTAPIETFLVPIDVCYSLAGALRLEWHGFDGGAEVKRIVADLLADLGRRARALETVVSRGDDPPYPPMSALPGLIAETAIVSAPPARTDDVSQGDGPRTPPKD